MTHRGLIAFTMLASACAREEAESELLWRYPAELSEESVFVHTYRDEMQIGPSEDPVTLDLAWDTLGDAEQCSRIHSAQVRRRGGSTSTVVHVDGPRRPSACSTRSHRETLRLRVRWESHGLFGHEDASTSIVFYGDGSAEAGDRLVP